MSFRTNVAKALATALVASGMLAATAQATSNTIGPVDLVTTGGSSTLGSGVTLNTEYPGGGAVEVPEDATITGWHGNFDCTDGCGEVRLVQLRATADPDVFDVIDTSPWMTPTGGGFQDMPANFDAQQHDLLGFEGRDGGKVANGPLTGGRILASSVALSGSTFTRQGTILGSLALYNADFVPRSPTETSITAAPNPALVNETVTLTAQVTSAGVASTDPDPEPSGTVAFTRGGAPITGCGAVPLVDGAASCQEQSGPHPDNASLEATYSGDADFGGSGGTTHLRVRDVSSTVASVTPNPVARLAPVSYVAEISGVAPAGGQVSLLASSAGTVAFSVDGTPVAGCAARPVDHDGFATCQTLAPPVGGTHTLKADFSGATYLSASTGTTPFVVLAPAVTLPETVDFASVTVGAASTRTVTLSNSGNANVSVSAASIDAPGAFAISADGCTGTTLAPGAGCEVQVAFAPAAAGPYAAKLVFSDDTDAGSHSTTVTGTGVGAPVPPTPTPPAPTATPTPTPQPGATLAPGAKPTLTVTAPSSANPNAAPTLSLPLSCPANEECQLDGTLKIATSALSKFARAAAAETTTVARFSKVQIAQGKLKTIKLKLSPAFVKSAQKRGITKIKATLTINTVLGSGQRVTTRQDVTVLIPKAPKRKAAPRPKFTG